MKFVIDTGTGNIWSMLIPPNIIIIVAIILAVLIIVHWHYKLKNREIQSRELKEIRDDHREKEIAGLNSEGVTGHRPKESRGVHEQHSLQ